MERRLESLTDALTCGFSSRSRSSYWFSQPLESVTFSLVALLHGGRYMDHAWSWERWGKNMDKNHHGTMPAMKSSPKKPTETHLSEVNVVQPIGGLGVATSISCILSFCGGAGCADFRFDFDAFWDGGDGWWWLGVSFVGFLEGRVVFAGKTVKRLLIS